jgi:hypothetical protein
MRLGLILLLSSCLYAQTHGTPASVTSLAPSNNGAPMVTRGVPASVTSLGPQGFTPQPRVFPEPQPRLHDGGRGHHGSRAIPVYVPVYGYGYYYDDYYNQQPQQQVVERVVEREAQPQKLEIVITDKRDEEKKAQAEAVEQKAAAEPRQSNLSEPPGEPAIFILKDGSRLELANFAIMQNTLYDLSSNRVRKISMDTLDRDATLSANAKAGRDITLP